MMICLIACVGKNLELGLDGDLVFHIREDMRFFRAVTMGHGVLMGARTFLSLPRALPGRENYVLTRSIGKRFEGATAVNDLEEFLEKHRDEVIFGIGGAEIYRELLPFAGAIYLTEVEAGVEADVYFPDFEREKYDKIVLGEGQENGLKFVFAKYIKRK